MSWTIAGESQAAAAGGAALRINIIGLGPAGAILALRAAARGWEVHAFDPGVRPAAALGAGAAGAGAVGADAVVGGHGGAAATGSAAGAGAAGGEPAQAHAGDRLPDWPATYGAFAPEVPAWAEDYFSPAEPIQVTPVPGATRTLGFGYRMMAKDRLRAAVADMVAGTPPHGAGLWLRAEGLKDTEFATLPGITVDCRGAAVNGSALWQVAVGYVLAPASSDPDAALPPALRTPTLMDWTPSPAASPASTRPSFLYVQKLPEGWLAEETILATGRPPAEEDYELLRQRLEARLAAQLGGDEPDGWKHRVRILHEELVAIPMGTTSEPAGVPRFGARDGFIHPATGYSVGTSLTEADRFLDRLATQAPHGLRGAARRANVELARVLRRIGSQLLAQASTPEVQSFFGAFFALPTADQLAYLSGRSGIKTARTMWRLRKNTGWSHPVLQRLYRHPLRHLRFGMRRS